jgi:hypothetical protein
MPRFPPPFNRLVELFVAVEKVDSEFGMETISEPGRIARYSPDAVIVVGNG